MFSNFATRAARVLPAVAAAALAVYVVYRGGRALDYDWQWARGFRYFGSFGDSGFSPGPLLDGIWLTMRLAAVSSLLAVLFGLAAAAAGFSRLASLRLLARAYIDLARGTPLLAQLYLLYFMASSFLGIDRFAACALALAFFEGAFAAEIVRAGVESVPRGQWDSARALGLSRTRLFALVVLPQSLPLLLPALANLLVALLKHSSIVTIVALDDLTNVARNIVAETFLVYEIWFPVAAAYIALATALSFLIGRWEAGAVAKIRRRGGRA